MVSMVLVSLLVAAWMATVTNVSSTASSSTSSSSLLPYQCTHHIDLVSSCVWAGRVWYMIRSWSGSMIWEMRVPGKRKDIGNHCVHRVSVMIIGISGILSGSSCLCTTGFTMVWV